MLYVSGVVRYQPVALQSVPVEKREPGQYHNKKCIMPSGCIRHSGQGGMTDGVDAINSAGCFCVSVVDSLVCKGRQVYRNEIESLRYHVSYPARLSFCREVKRIPVVRIVPFSSISSDTLLIRCQNEECFNEISLWGGLGERRNETDSMLNRYQLLFPGTSEKCR